MQSIFRIDKKTKLTRMRLNPTRKWMPCDEKALINFLKQNREFEKPTGLTYYQKFLDETPINVGPKLVRAKVRNMRMCYKKAKNLENPRDANALSQRGETIRDAQLKIFRYFDDFEDLFNNDNEQSQITFDTSIDQSMFDDLGGTISNPSNPLDETTDYTSEEEKIFPLTNLQHKPEFQTHEETKMFNIEQQNLDLHRTFKEKEFILLGEKLLFAKEKLKMELDLREKEIQSHERVKILELEMRERIAMKKLEMKERLTMKELEKK